MRITRRDIERATERSVNQLHRQVIEARHRELDLQIHSRLLAIEAKKRGISTTKLLEQEVVAKVKEPTEAEAQIFYNQNKARIKADFKDAREDILQYLRNQRQEEEAKKFAEGLRVTIETRVEVPEATPPRDEAERARVRALVNGERITSGDVEDSLKPFIFDVQERVYQLRKNELDLSINDALLVQEAQKRKITTNALLDAEIKPKTVTEAEARAFHEQNKDRVSGDFAQMKESIIQYLLQMEVRKAERAFVEKLRGAASIQIFLIAPESPVFSISTIDQPSLGDAAAPVTIVEFTDYQCPSCASTHPTLERLVKEYGNRVRLVARDFPLSQHPDAFKAAEAAEAAREQGKYWEYIGVLMRNQTALSVAKLKDYAGELALDRGRFDQALESGKFVETVQRDIEEGTRLRMANQRFPETSAVPGTGLSITGQRFINNGFVVDGLSANDDAADLPGTFYSQEVIREFEVITSGGIAQFGRASGGFVNILTQSGTNTYRGRLYGFFRNQRFDARNPLAAGKDSLTQAQYGVSIGGPIVADRSFFFTNFEQTRLHNAAVITISNTDVAAVNRHLDAVGYNASRLSTGIFPTGFNATNFLLRFDHQLTGSNQLSARYALYDIRSVNSRNVGGLNAVSRGTALSDRDQSVAIGEVAAFSSRTVNEARFQYMRSRLDAAANDPAGPAVNISGAASFGTATFSPTRRDLDTYEFVETITTQRGAHSLKGGANYLLNRLNIIFPGTLQGVYTFSSLANFQANRYATFQQAFGAAIQFQSNANVGLFIQDEWKPTPRLSINAGIRYDAQFLPEPITTDANNFSPRLGVAYAPGDHKTVLRASFGIFFDRIPLRATSNALQRDGTKYKVAVLSFGQPGAPVFPNTLTTFPTDLLVSITTIDPKIKDGYSEQVGVQVERELASSTTLSIGFLYTRGLHIIISRNLNVPTVPASAGIFNLGRPDSRFANISRFESSGDSRYRALTVSLNRRFQRWFGFRFSYTLSKAIDNAGNAFFFTPQDNFNLRDERGLADNDERHLLTLSGTFEAPPSSSGKLVMRALNGFKLSYIFRYGSRLPFNIVTGNDRNFDTNVNDRPVGAGRNTGKGFNFAALDLRLSRSFRLTERIRIEAMAEGFNLLNRANVQLPNNVYGAGTSPLPSFGQPTAAADPRQIQFGLRIGF